VPHGGQNPIEPVMLGCAVIHGPHVHNFADVYVALDALPEAAPPAADAAALAAAVSALLADGHLRDRRVAAAGAALRPLTGALAATWSALSPYLPAPVPPAEVAASAP
jgi:3-deoxy-D-manno-octulosonic-acid transferase